MLGFPERPRGSRKPQRRRKKRILYPQDHPFQQILFLFHAEIKGRRSSVTPRRCKLEYLRCLVTCCYQQAVMAARNPSGRCSTTTRSQPGCREIDARKLPMVSRRALWAKLIEGARCA